MDIIFYHPTFDTQWWIEALHKAIPQARVRAWKSGDNESADYALVWHPPVEMLAGRDLKAVFALGAGVDSILSKLQAHPEMLKPSVPLFRLEDTGMGEQMQEYAVSQVLHWFRRFDDYRLQQNSSHWQPLPEYHREDLPSAFWAQAYWAVKLHRVCKPGASRCVAGVEPVNRGLACKVLPDGKNFLHF